MSDILIEVYNAFDPAKPAEPKYYVNFAEERGGDTFIRLMCYELNKMSGGYVRALFTGHIGCGKSSELEHLATELEHQKPAYDHKRYFPIVINALEYLDTNDASVSEILLAIVAEIALVVQDKAHIQLKDTLIEKRLGGIQKILMGDLANEGLEINLGIIKTRLNLRLAGQKARDKVREALELDTSSLIREINTVIDQARAAIRTMKTPSGEREYDDFILILDNLEKINQTPGEKSGEASQTALFLDGAPLLTGLNVHTIYTVPLVLVRSIGARLTSEYGREAFVLPNVKTEIRKTHAAWEPGWKKLREMVGKRVHPYTVEQVFEADALAFLMRYSGGHLRDFTRFVQQSTNYTKTTPIPLEAAESAVLQAVPRFDSNLHDSDWTLLAELECSALQKWDNSQLERRNLLENLSVLEYLNGNDPKDKFNKATYWYAVHPIVRELNSFMLAVEKWKAAAAANALVKP